MSDLWKDMKWLTNEEKLMYVYLMSNRFKNICGCYHILKSDIESDLGMSAHYVNLLLKQLCDKHIISYDSITNEILITDMYKYVENEKYDKLSIEDIIKKIDNDNYKDYIKSAYVDMENIPLDDTAKLKKKGNGNINNLSKQVIDYLNEKCNTNYRSNANYIRNHISARMNEGNVEIEDYKHVIDIKYNQWKGTKYEKYLRPQTLFGTKFESYLNEYLMKNEDASNIKNEEDVHIDLWD